MQQSVVPVPLPVDALVGAFSGPYETLRRFVHVSRCPTGDQKLSHQQQQQEEERQPEALVAGEAGARGKLPVLTLQLISQI